MLVDSARAISHSLDALTRLAARSYFCTCWKVRPMASARRSWLIPSSLRRILIRRPTWRSMGLGPVSGSSDLSKTAPIVTAPDKHTAGRDLRLDATLNLRSANTIGQGDQARQ